MSLTREMWYRNPEVMFNIFHVQRNRELAFLQKGTENAYPIRNMFPLYTDMIKMYIGINTKTFGSKDPFKFLSRAYNLYYSLANYKNVRAFSFRPDIRKQESIVWNKVAVDNMTSFDIGLDFDSPCLEEWKCAYDEAKLIKKDFDKYKVPYTIKWSGGKGFHIKIPYSCLPKHLTFNEDEYDLNGMAVFIKAFGEIVAQTYGRHVNNLTSSGMYVMRTLDIGVFDLRRVWKCDYSWTCETGLIAYPLTDEQFDNFTLDVVKPENVLKTGLRNRFDLQREGTAEGFKKFCEECLAIEW